MAVARYLVVAVAAAGLLATGPGMASAAPSAVAVSRFDDGSFEYPTAPSELVHDRHRRAVDRAVEGERRMGWT